MKYPYSMTGFGRGDNQENNQAWNVEVKSVNHRFADIKIRLPNKLKNLEQKIKAKVSEHFSRGHIEITIQDTGTSSISQALQVNIDLARQYHNCLLDIKTVLHLNESKISSLDLLKLNPDIIIRKEQEVDSDKTWLAILPALENALNNNKSMRAQEGSNLKNDLLDRLKSLAATITTIDQEVPKLLSLRQENLTTKLNKLLAGIDLDPIRLAQEAAILADKMDITEEIIRLQSHISQFSNFLSLQEPTGRRLDFLLQEFLREINTLASKISNSHIAHLTVELKNEVEKIREQVQNIE